MEPLTIVRQKRRLFSLWARGPEGSALFRGAFERTWFWFLRVTAKAGLCSMQVGDSCEIAEYYSEWFPAGRIDSEPEDGDFPGKACIKKPGFVHEGLEKARRLFGNDVFP